MTLKHEFRIEESFGKPVCNLYLDGEMVRCAFEGNIGDPNISHLEKLCAEHLRKHKVLTSHINSDAQRLCRDELNRWRRELGMEEV